MRKNSALENIRQFTNFTNKTTYLYFIISSVQKPKGWCNSVKIGVGCNPEKRLKVLQTGSPHQLQLWYKFKVDKVGALGLEKDLHANFGQNKKRGSWFNIRPNIRKFIKEHRRLSRPVETTVLRKKQGEELDMEEDNAWCDCGWSGKYDELLEHTKCPECKSVRSLHFGWSEEPAYKYQEGFNWNKV